MKTLILIEKEINARIIIYTPQKKRIPPPGYDYTIMLVKEGLDRSHLEVEWKEDTYFHIVITNMKIEEKKLSELKDLIKKLREISEHVGSLHAYWDVIFDIEAFIRGDETMLKKTSDEWIEYAKDLLEKRQ